MDGTIAALYAQAGYTARIAHDAATGPQAAVAMAQVMTEELLKQEKGQVQQVAKGEEARVADDKQDKHQSPQHDFGSRRRSRNELPPETDDDPGQADSPLVGNLLNLKV